MGLDQYAYARPPRKRNSDNDESLCEWRKHNRLQGYMESFGKQRLSKQKVDDDGEIIEDFNCVELQLTQSTLTNSNTQSTISVPELDSFGF